MSRLFLAGATGLVGRRVLKNALRDPRITEVTAPTRRPLEHAPKLTNPVIDFESLPETSNALWQSDAAICTLGTTRKKAGSAQRFREIDFDIPLQIAVNLRKANCQNFVLVSSLGANPAARALYPRVKGELEAAIADLGFQSYIIVRPSLLGGTRNESRPGESIAKLVLKTLRPLVPKRYRIVEPETLASSLINLALASESGNRTVESDRIQEFAT